MQPMMSQGPDLDFKVIIQHLHDGLYVVDPSRRILHWNEAAERITGFQAAEVIGRSCADNVLMHVDADGNQLCEEALRARVDTLEQLSLADPPA